ncbi:hypothetical protein [Amycolatopsis thailandensis]|uniref:hypothetical protein n=1 Tax=Amycolatopsis thailandensis TaxID=589330 RepID=UPI0036296CA1
MTSRSLPAAVAIVASVAGIGAYAPAASAAIIDCSSYELRSSNTITSGESRAEPDGSFFWSWNAGTFQACLDGPDGATFALDFQRYSPEKQDWETISTAPAPGADKIVEFTGPATVYRLLVTAVEGKGSYTAGVNRPE